MKMSIPTGYPGASFDALTLLYGRTCPSLDDLRVMSMIEAAGEYYYRGLAAMVSNEEARQLLLGIAQDERRHAERLVQAFALLGGGTLTLPAVDDNPYAPTLCAPPDTKLDADYFSFLATAEDDGYVGYTRWAEGEANPEVAALYRLNAREERLHGKRDLRVKELVS